MLHIHPHPHPLYPTNIRLNTFNSESLSFLPSIYLAHLQSTQIQVQPQSNTNLQELLRHAISPPLVNDIASRKHDLHHEDQSNKPPQSRVMRREQMRQTLRQLLIKTAMNLPDSTLQLVQSPLIIPPLNISSHSIDRIFHTNQSSDEIIDLSHHSRRQSRLFGSSHVVHTRDDF